jgi:hypothetical protein
LTLSAETLTELLPEVAEVPKVLEGDGHAPGCTATFGDSA